MNTSIDRFYGLNMNETGDTQLALGESGKMVNFRITKDNKLEKMYGYRQKYAKNGIVRAMWVGNFAGEDVFVYVCGGKVYNKDEEIGTLTDDVTRIFEMNEKLYFPNGHEYKSWDGTTFGDAEPYIPLVMEAAKPNGEGTLAEQGNMLTDKKHMLFSADGEATEFVIFESDIQSIDKVLVDGIEVQVTKDVANHKITFSTKPLQGVNNVDVYWTGKATENKAEILGNYFACTYGLADDTRVFLYGNKEHKNRLYFSALDNTGVPNATYFPDNNFTDVGSSNDAITDIQRQYDRIVITKEFEAYYGGYTSITDTTGSQIITFEIYPLNSSHGAVPYNQGQVLDNYVTTIDSSIIQWVSTNTKDEKNAQVISEKIQEWLNNKDLTKAVTLDYQEEKEYWIAIENEIMIYNYANGAYYFLQIPSKIQSFTSSQGIIYFGTEDGKIMAFDEAETTYNGETIKSEWQMGYYDFGAEERRKTMRILWLTLKPHAKTSVVVNYISDRNSGTNAKEVENRCIDYAHWNYADFTYNTQRSVKPFRIKLKAKKFAFLKLILTNDKSDEKLTINSIAIKSAVGGEVK